MPRWGGSGDEAFVLFLLYVTHPRNRRTSREPHRPRSARRLPAKLVEPWFGPLCRCQCVRVGAELRLARSCVSVNVPSWRRAAFPAVPRSRSWILSHIRTVRARSRGQEKRWNDVFPSSPWHTLRAEEILLCRSGAASLIQYWTHILTDITACKCFFLVEVQINKPYLLEYFYLIVSFYYFCYVTTNQKEYWTFYSPAQI